MTLITKALIVDQPWIDLILSGTKTWEMRSTGARHRGWFALIRKGSGQVIGVACLTGTGRALTPGEMIATFDRHRIPEDMIRSGEVEKWTIPWHLADVQALPRPVPYRHRSGAVKWVKLAEEVSLAIRQQFGGALTETPPAPPPPAPQTRPVPMQKAASMPDDQTLASATGTLIGESKITQGGLTNSYFSIRRFLDRFPAELVNGSTMSPPIMALVEAPGMLPVETDICPRHRFFRDRSWSGRFLAQQDAAPGDRVQVRQIAPLHYRVTVVKA